MIAQDTLLVTLLKLVTRIPVPLARKSADVTAQKPIRIACFCKPW